MTVRDQLNYVCMYLQKALQYSTYVDNLSVENLQNKFSLINQYILPLLIYLLTFVAKYLLNIS